MQQWSVTCPGSVTRRNPDVSTPPPKAVSAFIAAVKQSAPLERDQVSVNEHRETGNKGRCRRVQGCNIIAFVDQNREPRISIRRCAKADAKCSWACLIINRRSTPRLALKNAIGINTPVRSSRRTLKT
jgi:hypothetical protein